MNRVLISGATGFIGRSCLPILVSCGYEVHAITSKMPGESSSEIRWHHVNLLELNQISELMSVVRPNFLLHLAWYVVPGKFATAYENFLWVQSSLELLKQFHEHGGTRAVIAGSCYEYDWNYGYCSEFLTPREPSTFYGKCKNALQILLNAYSEKTEINIAWGRVFFVYGPHEHPARLVPSVIISLLRGEIARCTHGNQIRDYLHVQDVAKAFVGLMESHIQGPVNIASGRPIALKGIVCKIAQTINREELIQLGALPTAANEPELVVADVSRLSKELGWHPRYSLDQGLQITIDWWKKQLKNGDF